MNCPNDLKSAITSYSFIATPFILLIVVKVLTGKFEELILTGDWSIASAMIYSSAAFNVRSATRDYKGRLNEVGLDGFMARTMIMSSVSVTIYVLALTQDHNYLIGALQIALFIVASIAHIKYSRLAYCLKGCD